MKKRKTEKFILAAFEAEAKRLGGSVSNNQRRFMNTAVEKGKDMEPAGAMAGAHDSQK